MIQDWPVETEMVIAAGYALFLAATAFILERVARHTHKRSHGFRTNGFTYHPPRDEWECPGGHSLERRHGQESNVAIYRAKAHLCNACLRKDKCTDSNEGRELAYRRSPWVETQAGRFHRGISLLLFMVAAFILVIEIIRHHDKPESILPGLVLLAIFIAGSRSAQVFMNGESPAEKER